MKKLFKSALSLAICTIVGIPQMALADNNPNDDLSYQLQIKSYNFSKDNANGLKGVAYKNTYPNNPTWPMTDAYTKTEDYQGKYSFVANYHDFYNNITTNNKECYVKQFGVSMGVVYWIVPTKNVIYYWNTVTGEVGEFVPPAATYQGQTYSFEGATTGYGNITHDWYGNLVHQWNKIGVASPGINTPAQGFAIYKAPTTYGELITTAPKLSDMTTCNVPYDRAQLKAGSTTQVQVPQIWNRQTTPNPNIPSDARQSLWNQSIGKKVAMDYMGASGDFWGGSDVWAYSAYFQGKASGYLFFAYNTHIYGQMIAEGEYANWYLNYTMRYHSYRTASNASLTTSVNSESLNAQFGHSREFLFKESDPLEYFWSVPFTGVYESSGPAADDDTYHNAICVLPHNWNSSLTNQNTDWMSAPEVDSIKGYRILINSVNLNRGANETAYRTGSIELNYCEYTGHDYVLSTKEPVSRNYSNLSSFYAYNNTRNGDPLLNHSVNSWNELERVNENVMALYTHVPGKGFSKYYITAVEENNPVLSLDVKISDFVKNKYNATITWSAQKYDRKTLNRYEVWYKTFKRDANGNLVTDCNDTWTLAGVSKIEYPNGNYYPDFTGGTPTGTYNSQNSPKGTFVHELTYGGANTSDPSDNYDVTYRYMVIPIYEASDHRGTERIATTDIVAEVPDCIIDGTFKQVTDKNVNGETLYGFSVQLEPKVDVAIAGANSAQVMIIVPQDDVTKEALADNTSVTVSTGDVNESTSTSATYSIKGTNDFTVDGYHVVVDGFSVGTNGELPIVTWHNINPENEYKVKVYIVATSSAYFTPSNVLNTTLVVPSATLSLTEASVHPLVGDYSSLQNNNLLPLGAQRRVGSNEVTNPVTLSNANTLGTKGSAINPLLVTDEVLENWSVKYRYNIFKNGGFMVAYDLDASDEAGGATYYSNINKVMFDIVGLPIERTAWDTHTQMGLNDAQKAINENITKYGYNTSTASYNYTAHIDVTYTRKSNTEVTTFRGGQQDASSPIVFSDAVKDGSIFPNLGVNFGSQFVVVKRDQTHWDEDCKDENGDYINGGYFSVYYDAVAQWEWNEYTDDLNRYVGFHAVTSTDCVGHYVNNSNTWIPYYAPSVLSDYYVDQTNISLGKPENFTDNYNGEVEPLTMEGIGYNGTADTDWSALAAEKHTLPMQVHYVWGGNRPLTNDKADRESVSTKVLMTADYPIIESTYGATIIHNAVTATNDDEDSYYTLIPETNAKVTRMNMISSENNSGVFADYVVTLTGVEGILVNAAGGVKLYPNPVGSSFTLEAPMTMNEVKIFTTNGQLVKVVKDIDVTKATINVDDLPQGVYIVNTLGVAQLMIKL